MKEGRREDEIRRKKRMDGIEGRRVIETRNVAKENDKMMMGMQNLSGIEYCIRTWNGKGIGGGGRGGGGK